MIFLCHRISEEEYVQAIREEISKVVKLQEELDIDVLVHGEPEVSSVLNWNCNLTSEVQDYLSVKDTEFWFYLFQRNDMVEYFGEQLSGITFTVNGWVQSYGSRCVKPPIIYGDVSRPKAMTVFWSSMAQSMTSRPMKAMLTGPVTILNWSFVRNDQPRWAYMTNFSLWPSLVFLLVGRNNRCMIWPRFETCYQIALAIKKEVEDLEAAGIQVSSSVLACTIIRHHAEFCRDSKHIDACIQVIQIDEAALREGLPLHKSEQAFYLDWAVHSFRITNCGVKDTTQVPLRWICFIISVMYAH